MALDTLTPEERARRPDSVPGPCVFCEIVAEREPAVFVRRWTDAVAIAPLEPVTDGHVLVLPRVHVRDATDHPETAGMVMRRAASLAVPPCNLITSAGREATQSVFHLHVHIVPRAENDGLALPWYSGRSRKPSARAPQGHTHPEAGDG